MKKLSKKVIAFALAVVMTLTAGAVAPQGNVEVQAASGRVYVNPYSATVVTYKPGKDVNTFTSTISIMGCNKAKEIKNSIIQCVSFKEQDISGKIQANICVGDKTE